MAHASVDRIRPARPCAERFAPRRARRGAGRARRAAPPPLRPLHRIEYNNTFGGRYNPLGLSNRLDLFYRYRLSDNPGLLYRDAGLGIGLSPELTPGFGRIGPVLEIKPLSILTLQAGYHFIGHFGTFDLLQGFDSARDDFRDATQDERSAAGLANAVAGPWLTPMVTLLVAT